MLSVSHDDLNQGSRPTGPADVLETIRQVIALNNNTEGPLDNSNADLEKESRPENQARFPEAARQVVLLNDDTKGPVDNSNTGLKPRNDLAPVTTLPSQAGIGVAIMGTHTMKRMGPIPA